MKIKSKESLQENQYTFPYHHITHEEDGSLFIFRHLFWGLEHYTYLKFVIEKLKDYKHSSLADIGCGEGRIIKEIKSFIPENELHGYDVSESALRFARSFTSEVNFTAHDITKAKTNNLYQTIVSCEVIEHIKPEKVDSYCKNIASSLIEGGQFFLTTPTANVPVNKKHYQHFTKDTLSKYLSPYFTIEEVVYLNCVSIRSRFLNRLIANRYFLSNSKSLNKWVLKQYRKYLLIGNKDTGSRIYLRCKKI